MTAGEEMLSKIRQSVCMDIYEELAVRRSHLRGAERMRAAMVAADSVYVDGMTRQEWFHTALDKLP